MDILNYQQSSFLKAHKYATPSLYFYLWYDWVTDEPLEPFCGELENHNSTKKRITAPSVFDAVDFLHQNGFNIFFLPTEGTFEFIVEHENKKIKFSTNKLIDGFQTAIEKSIELWRTYTYSSELSYCSRQQSLLVQS